jgi:hypothetical protein
VAQICNLLYRRIVFCNARRLETLLVLPRLADCKSAIQQIENLRYGSRRCLLFNPGGLG